MKKAPKELTRRKAAKFLGLPSVYAVNTLLRQKKIKNCSKPELKRYKEVLNRRNEIDFIDRMIQYLKDAKWHLKNGSRS